jgi:hypothetical protein
MNTLSPVTSPYLLEDSIEDLHGETQDWLTGIRAWQQEVVFYQLLLNKIWGRLISADVRQPLKQYQALLSGPMTQILTSHQEDFEEHERYLVDLRRNTGQANDQSYRQVHKKYSLQLKSLAKDIRQLKKELFGFIESAI